MANVLHLKSGEITDEIESNNKGQLNLPLCLDDFARKIYCVFDIEIDPKKIAQLVISEGIAYVADLRQVPFYEGNNQRHAKINSCFIKFGIPVFHLGTAYFSIADESLPGRLKRAYLVDLFKQDLRIRSETKEQMSRGACLLVVNNEKNVLEFANNLVAAAISEMGFSDPKLNRACSIISKSGI